MDWKRGSYGEILAPPLWMGLSVEDAVAQLVADSGNDDLPKRGKQLEGIINLALIHAHQKNLRLALAGRLNTPDGLLLFRDVVGNGQPLSLRPVSMERLRFRKFRPVLQRGDSVDEWFVGDRNGRFVRIQATAVDALEKAWGIYSEWVEKESAAVHQYISDKLPSIPMGVHHVVWGSELARDWYAAPFPGYLVKRLGGHGNHIMKTPDGDLLFKSSSPLRTARALSTLISKSPPEIEWGRAMDAIAFFGGMPNGAIAAKLVGGVAVANKGAQLSLAQSCATLSGKHPGSLVMPSAWGVDNQAAMASAWAKAVIAGRFGR